MSLPIALLVLIAGALLGLWPLLVLLHDGWTALYGPYEHGYLVLALALWLGIRDWRADPPQRLAPEWWAVIPLLAVIAGLGLLELMFINSLRLTLLPLLFIFAMALALGRQAALRLAWPALFLYFALPQWWVINGLMQSLTTAVVTRMVAWTGIPAFIEGNFVHLPSGIFEIASGCSGLNYLVVGLALAGFYALMYLRAWRGRLVLMALAAALALLSNWVRVYVLILVGHLSEMQHYLITVEHHLFGWVLFLVFMVPMLLAARRLEDKEIVAARDAGSDRQPAECESDRHDIGPGREGQPARATPRNRPAISAAIMPAALLAGLVLAVPRLYMAEPITQALPAAPLPATLAGLYPQPQARSAWAPVFVNASSDQAALVLTETSIDVYRAVYAQQDYQHRLVSGTNDILGAGFRAAGHDRHTVHTAEGPLHVLEHRGRLDGRERLVWSWYLVAGREAATPLQAKLAELRGVLQGRRDGAALGLSAECRPDCDTARTQMTHFLERARSELQWHPHDFINASDGAEAEPSR